MKVTFRYKGGKGSGHFGHSGRPGKKGGSLPGEGQLSVTMGQMAADPSIDTGGFTSIEEAWAAFEAEEAAQGPTPRAVDISTRPGYGKSQETAAERKARLADSVLGKFGSFSREYVESTVGKQVLGFFESEQGGFVISGKIMSVDVSKKTGRFRRDDGTVVNIPLEFIEDILD